MDDPLLFVSAGDPSGDNASGRVIAALKSGKGSLRLFGLGGRHLKELGQEQLADSSDLAVLGFWEVARRYMFFRKLFRHCVDEIERKRPALILLVDYPGFNLRLAREIKPLGIPIIYYISPQAWAWGKKRLRQIKQYVDRMLVILPFEEEFYRANDVACDFVGHYLLEDIPADYIGSAPPGRNQLALLPGSRYQEIERMLPPMLKAAQHLSAKHHMRSVVAGINGVFDYERQLERYSSDVISITYDNSRKVIHESDLVLTASGTATLEVGIIGRPMVVVYNTGFLTYQIAKRLVTLDMIALVNLVLGEKVVPELIQNEASPENMISELERYLANDSYRCTVQQRLSRLPQLLDGQSASQRAAELISDYL